MMKRILVSLTAALALALTLAVAAPTAASAQSTNPCTGKADTYFKFQYNFGVNGDVIDEGCADGNEVTRADVPDLIANELHVSCSDKFPGGIPEKSDLGDPNRRVEAWFISKDGGKKTCGVGTPIPAGGVMGQGLLIVGAAGLATAVGFEARRRRHAASPVSA